MSESEQHRIYFDNAATSWPKPESVYRAVDNYLRKNGAPAGRSVSNEAHEVERVIAYCRKQICGLLRADQAQVIFTQNGTHSLNLAIHGWLRSGDHVISTVLDHNSVLRPLQHLEDRGLIAVTRLDCDSSGFIDPDDFRKSITNETRLLILNHMSNVTGAIQSLSDFAQIAAEYGVPILLDAAQSIGTIPLNLQETPVAFLAAPGHKSLYGPLGSGILVIDEKYFEATETLMQGGTGTQSEERRQPHSYPEKFESGNLNVPALVGLSEGIAYVESRFSGEKKLSTIVETNRTLTKRLLNGLTQCQSVRLIGPDDCDRRGPIVSFQIENHDCREVAAILESAFRIQTRAGFHCAPLAHHSLKTIERGGAVRISLGAFNCLEEIDFSIEAIHSIANA